MKTRVITGIFIAAVYIAVMLLTLYVHPIFFDVFIFLIAMGGVYEMSKALSISFSPPILVLDIIAVVLSFGAFWFSQYFFKNSETYAAGMAGFFVALVVMIIVTVIVTTSSKVYVKGNALSTIFIMLYPTALLMFSVGLNGFIDVGMPGVVGTTPQRSAGIALMFLVPTFTDIMAYAVGSTVKGKKLCPTISPNKTISGAVGGLVGGLLGAGLVIIVTYLATKFSINLFGLSMLTDRWSTTIINLLALGLFGSVMDQLGDLFASYIKRKSGIKDFSKLLPGHGGVLDRVDGFIFCGVFFYMYFAFMILIV